MRPKEHDLFAEEQTMPSMSFGEHIEELRVRLILALVGLFGGLLITFIPIPSPNGIFYIGQWVMQQMQDPAQAALTRFYDDQAARNATRAEVAKEKTKPFQVEIPAASFLEAVRGVFPDLKPAPPEALADRTIRLDMSYARADWIVAVNNTVERTKALITLSPLEGFMIFFMVCLISGLVIASPWVFYQIWAFIGAGLYRHERYYVMKFMPFSVGLFLAGVFLCFFWVLPYTLAFLLDFNVWLGLEPMLRLTDWISFATMLPLIFGVCFQTPLVMLILAKLGIFTAEDFRSKRRFALLIIVVAAAAITPTGDPMTMLLLAVPMYALYELGIRLTPATDPVDVLEELTK